MAAFVIFDTSTGAVKGSYTLTAASQLAASMAANTRAGIGALQVPIGHPATRNNAAWSVSGGKLTQVSTRSPAQMAGAQQSSALAGRAAKKS